MYFDLKLSEYEFYRIYFSAEEANIEKYSKKK